MAELPTKWQALQVFWSSFGWAAYDENTVPDNAGNRYIAYEASIGDLDDTLYLSANLWHVNTTNWDVLDAKSLEIEQYIKQKCQELPIKGGRMRVRCGSPFSQRRRDPSDSRALGVLLNVVVEFVTANLNERGNNYE